MKNIYKNKELSKHKSEKLDWNLIQNEMKRKLGSEVYESWLKKIDFIEEFNSYILISVPTRFIRDWITSRYLDQILKIVKTFKKNLIRIEFKIVESNTSSKNRDVNDIQIKKSENISFLKDSFLQYNRVDHNKRFENFITGRSNKLAYEASLKVTENVSQYNPLYIYGGVGMGKTHLLNAVGFELKKIQFMNGKEAMQEEFFHTFNALLEKGGQIILSADRPPNKLSRIQERIKSRFSGGLVVDIQKPDLELRKNIIEKKISELNKLYADKVEISQEIKDFISLEISNSIRELVGAVNRIISFSRIYNKLPNLAETKIVLKDLLNINENKVTIDLIQTLVCRFFKISKNEMLSSRRSRYLVRPRQTAIYLTKILTPKSLPEIGREFSNRDHTTIIHSVKTIEKLKENDKDMAENIDKLKNQILYNNKENEI